MFTTHSSSANGLLDQRVMRHLACAAAVFALTLFSAAAHAGCEKDTDCKGDRICLNGECRSPAAAPAPSLAVPPLVLTQPHVRAGWSKGAGITGLVLAPIVLALFAGAAATLPDENGSALPAAPLGGAGLVLHIVAGGIAGGGAGSARGVKHNLGLVISGWVLYGVSILYTALEFAIGYTVGDGPPPAAAVGVGGVLSALSIVLLSVDGLIVAARANELLESSSPTASSRAARVTLCPVIAPVRSGTRTVGLSGGVALSF